MNNRLFKLSLPIAFALLCACNTTRIHYTTGIDHHQHKMLKGIINSQILLTDTAFKWFADNQKYGVANAKAVAAFSKYKNDFTMVVFGGTWCSDTQNLWPVFYRLVQKSGYPESQITLIAVNRNKEAPHGLHKKYNITHVPTFIVLKQGKEVGRIVEYGKKDFIDDELGDIVTQAFSR